MKLHKLMKREHQIYLDSAGHPGVSRVMYRDNHRQLVVNFHDGFILDATDLTYAKVNITDLLCDDWEVEATTRFKSLLGTVETAHSPPAGSLAWAKRVAADRRYVARYTLPGGVLGWLIEPGSPDLVFCFTSQYRQVAEPAELPDTGWVVVEDSVLEEEVRRTYRYIKAGGCDARFLEGAAVIRNTVVKAIEDTMLRLDVSLVATPANGFILNIPIDGNLLRHSAPLPCSLERAHNAGNGVPAAAFDSIADAVLYLVVRHQYLPLVFDPA